jgi:hypothetical protein
MTQETNKSTFEQWIAGEVENFGSFHTALLVAYQLADSDNRFKLEAVFPEWFV